MSIPAAAAAWTAKDSLPSPGQDVGSLSDNRPCEQERKELLIILLATRRRHTPGFLCVCGGGGMPKLALLALGVLMVRGGKERGGHHRTGHAGPLSISGCPSVIYCVCCYKVSKAHRSNTPTLIWKQTNVGRMLAWGRGVEDGVGGFILHCHLRLHL